MPSKKPEVEPHYLATGLSFTDVQGGLRFIRLTAEDGNEPPTVRLKKIIIEVSRLMEMAGWDN